MACPSIEVATDKHLAGMFFSLFLDITRIQVHYGHTEYVCVCFNLPYIMLYALFCNKFSSLNTMLKNIIFPLPSSGKESISVIVYGKATQKYI